MSGEPRSRGACTSAEDTPCPRGGAPPLRRSERRQPHTSVTTREDDDLTDADTEHDASLHLARIAIHHGSIDEKAARQRRLAAFFEQAAEPPTLAP